MVVKINFLLIVSLFILQKTSGQNSERQQDLLPNIILIFTDDQGYNDVGVFGAKDISTPNLDQMAKDGAKLTNFYAAQAVCSASRAAILTGSYPNRIGIHNALMPNSKKGLNPKETTLAEILKNKGYASNRYTYRSDKLHNIDYTAQC